MPASQARSGLQNKVHSQDVALFIDWENLKISLSQANLRVNVSSLRETAETFGRLVIANAYADWQEDWHQSDPENLYAAGIEPVYVPTRVVTESTGVRRRKNSVDIKLTADCVECCHNHPNIGTFILASGDGDFIHMVNTLRPYGKLVVAVGVSWSTSPRLADRVDQFLYYDKDVDPVDVPPYRGHALAPDAGRDGELQRLFEMVVEIVRSSQHGDRALLSWIKNEMIRRLRQFDESHFGFAKFKHFMQEAERRGLIYIVEDGLVDWACLPGGQEAEELDAREAATLEPIDETVMPAIIRFADGLEGRSPYVAFMYLVDQIMRAAILPHLRRDQLMVLLNQAVDDLIFLRGTYTFEDPLSNQTKNIRTLVLNQEHALVRETLGINRGAPAPIMVMPQPFRGCETPEAAGSTPADATPSAEPEPPPDPELSKVLAALETDAENPALLMNAARRYFQLRQYTQAIEYQQRAVARQPDNVEYACLLARTLSTAHRVAEAVALCRDIAARMPEHPLPHVTMGSILYAQAQNQVAGSDTDRHAGQEAGPSPDGSAPGNIWGEAAAEFQQALKLLADNPTQKAQLLLNIARCHERMGDEESACRICLEGLALAPEHPGLNEFQSYLNMTPLQRESFQAAKQAAALAVQPGREAETIDAAQRAIRADPEQYLSYYALGEVYQRLRHLRLAAENLEKAAAFCPSPATQAAVHQKLARLYARLGEVEKSQQSQLRANSLGADKYQLGLETALA